MAKKLKLKSYTKKDWVADLRSGKFRQGHDYLAGKREGKAVYCCLGVAAKGLGILKGNENESDISGVLDILTNNGQIAEGVEQDVMKALGLPPDPDNHPFNANYPLQDKLIAINDHGGSFKEIARALERGPKEIEKLRKKYDEALR